MPLLTCPDCGRQVSDQATACPGCGKPRGAPRPTARPQKSSSSAIGCLVLIGIGALGFILMEKTNPPGSRPPLASAIASAPDAGQHERELEKLKVTFKWKLGGFDNVIMATLTIENQNDFAVKDLKIQCDAYGKSGTRIDRNTRTIYDIVKARSKRKLPETNMGFVNSQADSLGCAILDFTKAP